MYRIFRAVGKFREHVTRFFATQIIIGVGKLHELNITHRDLKLENFMVDTDGYLQIIDFGLAGIIPQDKLSTTTCGTKEYFAPEIVQKKGYDRRVDWWAVGILIYEMLYGNTPFFSPNEHRCKVKILKEQPIFS